MSSDDTAQPSAPDNTNWTEQQLPPVKPPTTGFLMQLFFVPMIIVSIIVGVWIMFGWLAQSGTNPKQLAENLRQLNKGSWQDAHSLSNLLRDPREEALRQDDELATTLGDTLTMLLEDPNLAVSLERHKLATWLCRALGEFEVDNGIPALKTAVNTDDFKIRRAAIEGITRLAANLEADLDPSRADLVRVLNDKAMERAESSSRNEEMEFGEMRSAVAYALGVIGGDDAKATLTLMLADPYPEARYNAATGLARNGDLRSVDRLCEMLQVENTEATKYENEQADTLRQWKRNNVIINGVRGVNALYAANQSKPDDKLINAIQKVVDSDILGSNDRYRLELDAVLRDLKTRS